MNERVNDFEAGTNERACNFVNQIALQFGCTPLKMLTSLSVVINKHFMFLKPRLKNKSVYDMNICLHMVDSAALSYCTV